jgi:fatty-acyl-CoA synthase
MTTQADIVTIAAALEFRRAESPAAVAVDFPAGDRRLTFEQWDDAATCLARALIDEGMVPGDRVALLAENRPEWMIAHLGLARAGLVAVPVNTHFRAEELSYVLRQSRSRMLFLTESFRSNAFLDSLREIESGLPALERAVVIGSASEDSAGLATLQDMLLAGARSQTALPEVGAGDACAIIYTSGTTGRPKGATLAHEGVMANGRLTFERLGVTGDDVVTSIVPMFHSASYCTCLPGCLATGATYVGLEAFDAVEMMRVIQDRRATVHIGVPTTFRAMLNHPERHNFDLSSLRVGTCGGADTDPALLQECARTFPIPGVVQVYGLTEASALATCPGPTAETRFSTAGPPLPGYEVRIAPIPGEEAAAAPGAGELGEIQLRTRYRMLGYFDMDEESRATFTDDGWLRTGDVGSLTVDGDLVLNGARIKDIIIRGGENIYPAEIESVLHRHPGVREAAVFGVPHDTLGEVVVAAVVCDASTTAEQLSMFCAERLARFKVPTVFFKLAEMPLTASGKIRKVELQSRARDGALHQLTGSVS